MNILSFKEFTAIRGFPIDNGIGTMFGFKKDDALVALAMLKLANIAILGGDVFIINGAKAQPAYANWSCNPSNGEIAADFVSRSHISAHDYIVNYSQPEQSLFVLVPNGDI